MRLLSIKPHFQSTSPTSEDLMPSGSERGTPVVHGLVKPKIATSISQVGQEEAKAHTTRISHDGSWSVGSPCTHMCKLLLSMCNVFTAEQTAPCPFLQLGCRPSAGRPAVLRAGKEWLKRQKGTAVVLDIPVNRSLQLGAPSMTGQMRSRSSSG